MNTKLSCILLAFLLCSLVSWGSTFTAGAGKPKFGRQTTPKTNKQVCYVTPCVQ